MAEAELVKQAQMKIESLPEDTLKLIIALLDKFQPVKGSGGEAAEVYGVKSGTKKREPGGFDGSVIMADDFFETPDCFKQYV